MKQRTRLQNIINSCTGLDNELNDLKQFLDLSDIDNDSINNPNDLNIVLKKHLHILQLQKLIH